MPIATRRTEIVRHELKTCPGGFVELRQLSYDEMLERRDGASQILMDRGMGGNQNPTMAIKMLNKWSNQYSFPRCIVDHNLSDDQGVSLDFSRPELVFRHLDPRVGTEIESLIDALNQEAEEGEDFTPPSDSSSPDEQSLQSSDMAPSE